MIDTKKEAKDLLELLTDLPEDEKVDCISTFLDDLICDAVDDWIEERIEYLNNDKKLVSDLIDRIVGV